MDFVDYLAVPVMFYPVADPAVRKSYIMPNLKAFTFDYDYNNDDDRTPITHTFKPDDVNRANY